MPNPSVEKATQIELRLLCFARIAPSVNNKRGCPLFLPFGLRFHAASFLTNAAFAPSLLPPRENWGRIKGDNSLAPPPVPHLHRFITTAADNPLAVAAERYARDK